MLQAVAISGRQFTKTGEPILHIGSNIMLCRVVVGDSAPGGIATGRWCRGQQLRCYHVVPGALAWWSSHLIFNRCCLLEAAANDGDDAGLAWLANAEAVAPLTGVFSE